MGDLSAASHRPLVHLTPASGWINDPLALTWHGGRYHLFTQFVPGRVEWAPACHWAHDVSDDLLTWVPRPVALAPGDGDGGAWSGNIAVPVATDDPVGRQLFYTSVDLDDFSVGRVRVATPLTDDWDDWTKGDVVATLPAGVDAVAFRDPYVFHDGTCWRMLVGGGLRDGTAVAWTWTSADRLTWTYLGELVRRPSGEREPVWTGEVWECPVLFPLDGRWVLVFSVWEPWVPHWVGYAIGDLADGRFEPSTWGRLSFGTSYYAASTFVDADGRRGLIHWLRGVVDPGGEWAGAASIPHVVHLQGNALVARPHPATTTDPHPSVARDGEYLQLPAACWIGIETVRGQGVGPEDGPVLELVDGMAKIVLGLAVGGGQLVVTSSEHTVTMPLRDPGSIGVFVDHLVVEVFGDGGICAVPVGEVGEVRLVVRGATVAEVRSVATCDSAPTARRA